MLPISCMLLLMVIRNKRIKKSIIYSNANSDCFRTHHNTLAVPKLLLEKSTILISLIYATFILAMLCIIDRVYLTMPVAKLLLEKLTILTWILLIYATFISAMLYIIDRVYLTSRKCVPAIRIGAVVPRVSCEKLAFAICHVAHAGAENLAAGAIFASGPPRKKVVVVSALLVIGIVTPSHGIV